MNVNPPVRANDVLNLLDQGFSTSNDISAVLGINPKSARNLLRRLFLEGRIEKFEQTREGYRLIVKWRRTPLGREAKRERGDLRREYLNHLKAGPLSSMEIAQKMRVSISRASSFLSDLRIIGYVVYAGSVKVKNKPMHVWALASEDTKQAVVLPVVASRPEWLPHESLTAEFFGDPAPNRSALAQRALR